MKAQSITSPCVKEKVILLHGLLSSGRYMNSIKDALEKAGYEVLNIDHPSTRLPIEGLVEFIHPLIQPFVNHSNEPIHFVGHSLGGLVIRAYLSKYRPSSLGRIVMLGTPNYGSEVMDFLEKLTLFRWVYGPAGLQLTTNCKCTEHLFAPVDYELGVIAGSLPLNPLAWCIKIENDGLVSVKSTQVPGMKEHLVLPVEHVFLAQYPTVIKQVLHFLKMGAFNQQSSTGKN